MSGGRGYLVHAYVMGMRVWGYGRIIQYTALVYYVLYSIIIYYVLYLYSDFGNPDKREKTLNRSLEGWTSIYATKCLSAATLFGVYEAVRGPTSRAFRQLLSGGTGGCAGSEDYDLCLETYLVDNAPSATFEADFRVLVMSDKRR